MFYPSFCEGFCSTRTIVRVLTTSQPVCMLYVVCMYVWYVNFKISLLVDTVQSWPLIGRHDKGDLAGSSDVTVLEHSILYTEAD